MEVHFPPELESKLTLSAARQRHFWDSDCLTPAKGYDYIRNRRSNRLVAGICCCAAILSAQTAGGSITTMTVAASGVTVFDAEGNSYVIGTGGPITPGAVQLQPSGGTCYWNTGYIGAIPEPCPAVILNKFDAAGNMVFGAILGSSIAIDPDAIGWEVAVDATGSIYITGPAGSALATTPSAAIPKASSNSVFAAKLSANGGELIYLTYVPGEMSNAAAIAVDATGNAYLAGTTSAGHACVTRLSADGTAFIYTKVLAGSNQDSPIAVAVDSGENAIVAGKTNSPDFPVTASAFQGRLAGGENAFVTKLDSTGDIAFSTYLGGTAADAATSLQTDSAANIYVLGTATSLDLPTTAGSFESVPRILLWATTPGAFISKLSPDGTTMIYSTYLPQLAGTPLQMAVGGAGDAYVTGSAGPGLPVTQSAPHPCFGARSDVFVAHLDSGGALRDATYLGGTIAAPSGIGLVDDGSVRVAWFALEGPFHEPNVSQIHFGGAGWSAPACLSPDLLNSASFWGALSVDGVPEVSPGEFVTLTGWGIGPEPGVAAQAYGNGPLPLELAGVQVLFDGHPAPLLYVQSGQINLQAPFELNSLSVTSMSLEYNGTVFGPVTVPVTRVNGGLFRLQPNISTQALAVNEDGTPNGSSNPAVPGSAVSLWGTGFGPTAPACATGGVNNPGAFSLAPGYSVRLTDNGLPLSLLYAGSAPTLLCGITQINVVLPVDAQPGTNTISSGASMVTIEVEPK